MAFNTAAFITALTDKVNTVLPTFYEEAPTGEQRRGYPFAVINGLNITDLDTGDLCYFYIDVWVDEKKPNATEELEKLCDRLRNELTNEVVSVRGTFASHIGFENQNSIPDSEYDLAHRRLSLSARIFYN